jgi:hypothetical protein
MQAVTFLPTEDFLSKYSLAVNADESSQHAGTGKTVPDSFDAIFRSLFANKTVTATVAHILPNSYFGLPNDLLLRAAEFGQRYRRAGRTRGLGTLTPSSSVLLIDFVWRSDLRLGTPWL